MTLVYIFFRGLAYRVDSLVDLIHNSLKDPWSCKSVFFLGGGVKTPTIKMKLLSNSKNVKIWAYWA